MTGKLYNAMRKSILAVQPVHFPPGTDLCRNQDRLESVHCYDIEFLRTIRIQLFPDRITCKTRQLVEMRKDVLKQPYLFFRDVLLHYMKVPRQLPVRLLLGFQQEIPVLIDFIILYP